VRGVIRCLAPHRRSSSSPSPRLLFFFKECDALVHSERRKGQYLGWTG
jgi:hypothetical protein